MEFEVIGYSLDYYVDNKYIGSRRIEEKEDREIGYHGRVRQVLEEDIYLDNKRKIKAGTTVVSEQLPLNGKLIKK